MARLFLSLYLFITLALIGLSAGLESIFTEHDEPSNKQSEQIIRLFESASKLDVDLSALATNSQLANQRLAINDIAWPKSSLTKLLNKQAVSLFDQTLGEQVFIALDDNYMLQITLSAQDSKLPSLFLYSSVFFILLGLLVALWIWPLWRDLTKLKSSVSNVQPDGSVVIENLSKTSIVAPIAQSLAAMGKQVQNLMQSRLELTGAVAHEFRTPLARLKFALAIKPKPGSSPWSEMEQDVNELERLVQEMLDYAGTETNIPEMNLSEIPIKELCQQIATKLSSSHLEGIALKISGDNANILADSHFIERAIENLVLNARRYASSTIHICVAQGQEFVDISVEDDGGGIPQALRDKIFEPFFRLDEARDRAQGGAGLGLAIVKRIQQWHQGSCWVEDSSLGGAKFVLRFIHRL
jgi:two-component system OmpR family sensor kinase